MRTDANKKNMVFSHQNSGFVKHNYIIMLNSCVNGINTNKFLAHISHTAFRFPLPSCAIRILVHSRKVNKTFYLLIFNFKFKTRRLFPCET